MRNVIGASCERSLGTGRTAVELCAETVSSASGLAGIAEIIRFGLSNDLGYFTKDSVAPPFGTGS